MRRIVRHRTAADTDDTNATRTPVRDRANVRLLALLAASIVGVLATAMPIAAPSAIAARVVHVAPGGHDGASGGPSDPVGTLARAVHLAQDGDSIELAPGTYHESVQIYGKEVHVRAAPGADVVLDGAIPVGGFSASGGDWVTAWDTNFPRAGTPHVSPDAPEAGWPEQFFVDGAPLREVTTRGAVVPGTFFHDRDARQVWIGDDPNGRLVEGSALAWGLYFNRAHGSSLTGVTVRRYATGYDQMAAIRAYSDDLSFDGVTVELNAYMGLSMIGNRISVRNSTADRNGHLGFHGHLATDISVVDSTITNNNRERFDAWHAAGGLKITETTGITITDSFVVDNAGPGLWTDLDCSRVHMARNFVADNMRSGIELELSSDIVVVDNTVVDNGETGVWVLESRDTDVWHNALFGNERDIWVEDGPRSDVDDVELYANTLGPGVGGTPALLNVDDWTGNRSAGQMNVRGDHNAYWLPPGAGTPNISRWANWPYGLLYGTTIEAHRSNTGMDTSGTLRRDAFNPYVRDVAGRDYRMPDGAGVAAPLPAAVAAVALVPTGSRHPAGPINAWVGPTTHVTDPNPGTGGEPGPDPDPPSPTDVRAPSAPGDPTAIVDTANGSIAFSWDEPWDDVGVVSYVVRRNLEPVATVAAGWTTVTLDLGTGGHYLQVEANDAAGNTSVRTAPVFVEVNAPAGSTPDPTVPQPEPSTPSTPSVLDAAGGATVGTAGGVRGAPAVRMQLREGDRTLWSRSVVPVVQNAIGPVVRPPSPADAATAGRRAIVAALAPLRLS